MKALKVGGKRQKLDRYAAEGQSIFQLMLKWALENPNIASVVTEMLTFDQLEEDLAVTGQELSAGQRKALLRYTAENSRDYCHMCGRCSRACPAGIATTDILRSFAYHESYGKSMRARQLYRELEASEKAAACRDCGVCEKACPYGVSVRSRIREAHALLA